MHVLRRGLNAAVRKTFSHSSVRFVAHARNATHKDSHRTHLGFLAFALGISAASARSVEADEAPAPVSATNGVDVFEPLRPRDKDFVRIDEKVLAESSEFVTNHALHSNLRGESLVETFEVYINKKTGEAHVVAHFGSGLNGHPTVVHGGILALAFDETFGWLLHFGLKTGQAFTANLNVNYRKKTPEDSTVAIKAHMVEKNGRKMLMSATMVDKDGAVLADATSLFISSVTAKKSE